MLFIETLIVENLKKTFRLSKKQMKINKTNNPLKVAINNVSFKAYNGEIYGLLGSNGAGKTTTLRCISTLIKPDEGKITINNIDISNEKEIKKNIGFLTSELKLEEAFTPSYLFDYFARFYGLTKEEILERKNILFDKFKINDFKELKVSELSTGMRQKVSIAISILHNPSIIIFDEPTNGLDVVTAKLVKDFLMDQKKEGKTVIISTHIMSLVDKLCDRVGIIIDGEIKVSDTLDNIKKMHNSNDLEEVFFSLYNQKEMEKKTI